MLCLNMENDRQTDIWRLTSQVKAILRGEGRGEGQEGVAGVEDRGAGGRELKNLKAGILWHCFAEMLCILWLLDQTQTYIQAKFLS